MPSYFADSSAVVKRYVAETGTPWVNQLLDPSAGHRIYVARITAVEVAAAFSRRARGGSLAAAPAAAAMAQFRADLAGLYRLVEMTGAVIDHAMALAEAHGLRGYDAVQLAAALAVHAALRTAGLAVTLVSSDAALNAAAAAEGLQVDDPNAHP